MPAESLSGESPREGAVRVDGSAVHEDARNPAGGLSRLVEGGLVSNRIRIEDDEVRERVFFETPSSFETEEIGGKGSHPSDGIGKAQELLLADIAAEDTGKTSIGCGVGLSLSVVVGIGDERHVRTAYQRSQSVLAGDVQNELADAAALFHHQVGDGIEWVFAARAAELRERHAFGGAVALRADARDSNAVPAHRSHEVVGPAPFAPRRPVGRDRFDVVPNPAPELGVLEPRNEPWEPSLERPGRKDREHHRRRDGVGEHVRGELDSLGARGSLHLQKSAELFPVAPADRLGVRVVDVDSRLASDLG